MKRHPSSIPSFSFSLLLFLAGIQLGGCGGDDDENPYAYLDLKIENIHSGSYWLTLEGNLEIDGDVEFGEMAPGFTYPDPVTLYSDDPYHLKIYDVEGGTLLATSDAINPVEDSFIFWKATLSPGTIALSEGSINLF